VDQRLSWQHCRGDGWISLGEKNKKEAPSIAAEAR